MAWRNAESRAFTGPFPSAVATTRASSMRTLTVASVRCRPVQERVVGVIGDDPERLELEEVGLPSGGPAQKQLERSVGHLEVIAPVLEGLQGVEDAGEGIGVELEPELLAPSGPGWNGPPSPIRRSGCRCRPRSGGTCS